MRIGMLLRDAYPPDVRVRKEAVALADAGHEVTVYCYPAAGRPPREHRDGYRIVRLPGVDAIGGGRALRFLATGVDPAWRAAVADRLADGRVDAVHVHDLPLVRTALSARDRAGVDAPVVADLHENYPEAIRQLRRNQRRRDLLSPRPLARRLCFPVARHRLLEREAVDRVDAVLTVVEEARRHYVQDCHASPGDVHVVSNTVDLGTFDALAGPETVSVRGGPVLAYVGSLSGPHRGLETAVRALPRLREAHPAATLLLVGGGDRYARRLRSVLEDVDVDARAVRFEGRVPFEEVRAYMATADAGLVPHSATPHTETTVPHKLFQYMAAGTPVLASDVGPLERIVGETDAGEVFAADDPDSFADVAVGLLDDPVRQEACARNGRAAVEGQYNWERDAERLRAVYEDLADAPTAGRRAETVE